MKFVSKAWIAILLIFSWNLALASEYRIFKNTDGISIKAKLVSFQDKIVTLTRDDQKTFKLPIHKLSEEDQEWIKSQPNKANDLSLQLNQATGLNWITDRSFSENSAEAVANSLQLLPESLVKKHLSWRLYASFKKGYTLFGAMPYSVALYANKDQGLDSISIVFANKGDFGSTAGFASDHFTANEIPEPSSLEAAMTQDEETVSKALSSVLGESIKQRFGEGKSRRTVQRWDWNDYAFLLSYQEGEQVSLSIVSTTVADLKGKTDRVNDESLKNELLESVVRKENGDVFISEIPMVDQGPKGYCVPATFERLMRKMGVSADMYLLAMVGQTQAGGGTSVELLLDSIKSSLYTKGRRIKEEQIDPLKIDDLKKYIDQGIPLMWTMCSMEEYNEIANKNTHLRAETGKELLTLAKKIDEVIDSPKPDTHYHICMIIGYNEKTKEVAVSDSWGKSFEQRWVPLSIANWASMKKLIMILP